MASKLIPDRITGHVIVFLEHHPDQEKEMALIKSLKLDEVLFLNSLDDPLFALFNADRIKTVMDKMGHGDNEAMEHESITKSIGKAQEKIATEGLPADAPDSVRRWYDSLT